MKAGVALIHLCCPSPSMRYLAQFYRDTIVPKCTQALLEFAPVGDQLLWAFLLKVVHLALCERYIIEKLSCPPLNDDECKFK